MTDMDFMEYVNTADDDQLHELRLMVRRRLTEISLPPGQQTFVLIEGDPLMWLMEIGQRLDSNPRGPLADVHIGQWPSMRLGLQDAADGHYTGHDGGHRFAVRVSDDVGYILKPLAGHPDPRVKSITSTYSEG